MGTSGSQAQKVAVAAAANRIRQLLTLVDEDDILHEILASAEKTFAVGLESRQHRSDSFGASSANSMWNSFLHRPGKASSRQVTDSCEPRSQMLRGRLN